MKQPRAKTAIYEALSDLLLIKKFDHITVQDILDASTYSRSAFYTYFTDKYEAVQKMVEEEAYALEADVREVLDRSKDAENLREMVTHAAFQHIKDHRKLYTIIIRELIPGYSLKRYSSFCNHIFEKTGSWTVSNGSSVIDPQVFSALYSGAFYGCLQYWESIGFSLSVDYMTAQFLLILQSDSHSSIIQ